MNPADRNGQSSDGASLTFGQLLGLIATCCTGCLILGRMIGMSWLSSIAFAYVGGAALVIVGCLIALRLMESSLSASRVELESEPEDEWATGRHIDTARWSTMAREGTAAAPAGSVARRVGSFSDMVIDSGSRRSDIL